MKFNPFADLLDLLFPSLCEVCSDALLKSEHQICLSCLHSIPRTNYHLQSDNPVETRFWGKVQVARATSFFYFHKGSPYRKLLHSMKYKGNKEIGEVLGKYAAADLLQSDDFLDIDVIVPVPLHPRKYQQRGYNQSEWIARGLSIIWGKPLDIQTLIRTRENSTQTKKSVYERFENTDGIFDLTDVSAFAGKHVLVVDDVLTTGSTLEACIRTIQMSAGVRVSVFTLAVA